MKLFRLMVIPWLSSSFLLLGMLETFCSEFSYQSVWMPDELLTAVLVALVIFFALHPNHRIASPAVFSLLAGAGLLMLKRWSDLRSDLLILQYYINHTAMKYNGIELFSVDRSDIGDTNGSLFLMLMGFFLILYIVVVAFRMRWRMLGLFVVWCVPLFGMCFGKTPDTRSVLFLFFGEFLALGWISYQESGGNSHFVRGYRAEKKTPLMAGVLLVFVLLLGAFCAGFLGRKTESQILSHSEEMLEKQHAMERTVTRKLQEAAQFVRGQLGLDSEGRLSNSAPYYTGKTVMEITVRQKPKESLYLRGYTGASYENGKWNESSSEYFDERFYNTKREIKGMDASFMENFLWETGLDDDDDYVEDFAIVTDLSVQDRQPFKQQITIKHTGWGRISKYAYLPYYSDIEMADEDIVALNGDNGLSKLQNDYSVTGYLLGMYQIQEICSIMQEERPMMWYVCSGPEWDDLNDYLEFSESEYTKLPKQGLKGLKQFADSYDVVRYQEGDIFPKKKKGKKRILQLVEDVQRILWSTATYSKNLGSIPFGQDYVEYFLLTEKKGYCEHFATAGTLLLREYGVPARYVSGYRVPTKAFKQNTDGTYTAKVLDSDAHAWSEFLFGTMGWVPAEMTPADGVRIRDEQMPATVAPAMRTERPSPSETAGTERAQQARRTEAPATARPTPAATGKGQTEGQSGSEKEKIVTSLPVIVIVCVFLCFAGWIIINRLVRRREKRRLSQLRPLPSQYLLERLSQLHRLMRHCGVRKAEALEEQEWMERLCVKCGLEMAQEERSKIQSMIQKAAFSQENITQEELESFCRFAGQAEEKLYQEQNKVKQCYLSWLGWKKYITGK